MTAVLERPPELDVDQGDPPPPIDLDGPEPKTCVLLVLRPIAIPLGEGVILAGLTAAPCEQIAVWQGDWVCSHGQPQTLVACEEHHAAVVNDPNILRDGPNPVTVEWAPLGTD